MGPISLPPFCNRGYDQDGKQAREENRAPVKHAPASPRLASLFLLNSMLELSHQASCHEPCMPLAVLAGYTFCTIQSPENSVPQLAANWVSGDKGFQKPSLDLLEAIKTIPWRVLNYPEAQRYSCLFLSNLNPPKK